jgi:hypothetical protein
MIAQKLLFGNGYLIPKYPLNKFNSKVAKLSSGSFFDYAN